MVHVTDRAHVNVGLGTFKLTLGHLWLLNKLPAPGKELELFKEKEKKISGAHDADRTHDLSLTKGVLYH